MDLRFCSRAFVVISAVGALAPHPVAAFNDKDFCVVAEQLAIAAERDIGNWIDRTTRTAGMVVTCATKAVEFKRFSYAPAADMNVAWKERMSAEWSTTHCSSRLWREAIENGWTVTLGVWSADGGHTSLQARCR